jgi:hypothetical protein
MPLDEILGLAGYINDSLNIFLSFLWVNDKTVLFHG